MVIHLHMADDMSAAIIVTCEVSRVVEEWFHLHTLHIDIGYLLNIEVAIIHPLAINGKILQVGKSRHLVRFSLGTLTQGHHCRVKRHNLHGQVNTRIGGIVLIGCLEENGHHAICA